MDSQLATALLIPYLSHEELKRKVKTIILMHSDQTKYGPKKEPCQFYVHPCPTVSHLDHEVQHKCLKSEMYSMID